MPSTHSHTYTLQPAHAAIGLWVPSRQPARPYLGRAPLRTGPCSSGLSEQRALDPAGGPQSRPRRSRVGAGPELRRGGSLERHRQRGGAAPASESEPSRGPGSQMPGLAEPLGGIAARAKTLPAAPRDLRELKWKPNACSSLGAD